MDSFFRNPPDGAAVLFGSHTGGIRVDRRADRAPYEKAWPHCGRHDYRTCMGRLACRSLERYGTFRMVDLRYAAFKFIDENFDGLYLLLQRKKSFYRLGFSHDDKRLHGHLPQLRVRVQSLVLFHLDDTYPDGPNYLP